MLSYLEVAKTEPGSLARSLWTTWINHTEILAERMQVVRKGTADLEKKAQGTTCAGRLQNQQLPCTEVVDEQNLCYHPTFHTYLAVKAVL